MNTIINLIFHLDLMYIKFLLYHFMLVLWKMDEITEEQLININYGFEELFQRADKNQDGVVTTEECSQILESILGTAIKSAIFKHVY